MVFSLVLLLGAAQILVAHWVLTVVMDREGFGLATAGGLGALLLVFNGMMASGIRRARRRRNWAGAAARFYLGSSIALLLLGVAIGLSWIALLPVWGVAQWIGSDPEPILRGFRWLSLAGIGSVALLILWGFTGGQARVDRTRVRVPIPGLHPDLEGFRVVQISDLHIGNGLEAEHLERMLERTNALDPDVIVLTGDLFDFDPSVIEGGARRLSALRARYGVYAVLGNHDHYTGAEEVVSGLARWAPNIAVLRDAMVRLPVDEPLYLAGVEDPGQHWSTRDLEMEGLSLLAASRPTDGPVILLVHRPEAFPQAARLGFPLVLAGHTHGGQLALPTPAGRYNLARLTTRYARGLYRDNGSILYVNRGLGVGGPALRINCPREIATIELATSEAAHSTRVGPSTGAGSTPA